MKPWQRIGLAVGGTILVMTALLLAAVSAVTAPRPEPSWANTVFAWGWLAGIAVATPVALTLLWPRR